MNGSLVRWRRIHEDANLRAISFSLGSLVVGVDLLRQRFSVLYLVDLREKKDVLITEFSRFVKFCSTPGGNLIDNCSLCTDGTYGRSWFLEQSGLMIKVKLVKYVPLGKEESTSWEMVLLSRASLWRRRFCSQKAATPMVTFGNHNIGFYQDGLVWYQ